MNLDSTSLNGSRKSRESKQRVKFIARSFRSSRSKLPGKSSMRMLPNEVINAGIAFLLHGDDQSSRTGESSKSQFDVMPQPHEMPDRQGMPRMVGIPRH